MVIISMRRIFQRAGHSTIRAFAVALAIVPAGLVSAADVTSASAKVDFDRDIRPMFSDTCFKCHGPDESKRKAKLRLDTKAGAFAEHDGHAAIVPGDLTKSDAWRRVTTTNADDHMPPPESGLKLTERQIQLFGDWIRQGAKYEQHW